MAAPPRPGSSQMHLSSITIKGFKSFPERTNLVFSPGVSVIVGPNGCGKSNVTDAVLWARSRSSAGSSETARVAIGSTAPAPGSPT